MQASAKKRRATTTPPMPDWYQFSGGAGSPMSGSCITEEAATELYSKLREIESAMLGEEEDDKKKEGGESWRWARAADAMVGEEKKKEGAADATAGEEKKKEGAADAVRRGDVGQVLRLCAGAVGEGEGEVAVAEWLVEELRRMVSVSGEPLQRLGAYMLEGLVARMAPSQSSICRLLEGGGGSPELLRDLCPYFKFAYMAANGAIAEAMREEARVHIVDFRVGKGWQWETLIQAFAGRAGGPPRMRITAVGQAPCAAAARRLSRLAAACGVPFEFVSAAEPGAVDELEGEWAVAVNFAFALQRESELLLRAARGMRPRVVTVVEREFESSGWGFAGRFEAALGHYGAVFESMDEALPRGHRARIAVEQGCLAREVVRVVACEGGERHEPLAKWSTRLQAAGFRQRPLSGLVNATIARLLKAYSPSYCLHHTHGALYLGWMDRFLVTSSAWQCSS